jgi:hypothetical protein
LPDTRITRLIWCGITGRQLGKAAGGGKILAKEGLTAIGADAAAANIVLDDIQPLSSLGK